MTPLPSALLCASCWGRRRREDHRPSSPSDLIIDFHTLEAATDAFSPANLLGQGGFGPVYKGVLADGQEIAVKKLAFDSRQGLLEFTNEVRLLLRVQHRNLVSLLGCCAAGDEKMLVYPYFPNRSLDYLLFDNNKRAVLDWSKRFGIIVGVARGLLYLHEESPVKIIHRDVKASNILLDEQLKPKISDFGMARLFKEEDTHVSTFKIAGTYGYMAPEYAMRGYLSTKTDVFSYGVLVLEIVSGRKSLDKKLDEVKGDLLSYTWMLFQEGKALDIVDPSMPTWNSDEATLCIQIALLCCQASVSLRPDMYSVQLMLSSDLATLPKPDRPGTRGRVGRWTSTPSSALTKTTASSSVTKTTATSGYTSTDNTKASNFSSALEDDSRNSISVSFTTDGR